VRWPDERYVRVYTRNTGEWILLGWEAQALLVLALRQCDRAGILKTGANHARGLAAMVGMPLDVVTRSLPLLLEGDGPPMVARGDSLVVRNFLEAQESPQSDAQRSREFRARDRDRKLAIETNRDGSETNRSEIVTQKNDSTQVATSRHSVPCLSVPCLTVPNQIKRSPAARVECSPAFVEFWKQYPRKVAKGAAIKAWPGDDLLPVITLALDWQIKRWTDPQFIPHPATYLRQRRWEDEPGNGITTRLDGRRDLPQPVHYGSLKG
jgi:hypothetical protein